MYYIFPTAKEDFIGSLPFTAHRSYLQSIYARPKPKSVRLHRSKWFSCLSQFVCLYFRSSASITVRETSIHERRSARISIPTLHCCFHHLPTYGKWRSEAGSFCSQALMREPVGCLVAPPHKMCLGPRTPCPPCYATARGYCIHQYKKPLRERGK